jgi:hypothetical protein
MILTCESASDIVCHANRSNFGTSVTYHRRGKFNFREFEISNSSIVKTEAFTGVILITRECQRADRKFSKKASRGYK